MICTDDFGPGQNIRFFLVTTGLDVNTKNGTVAAENYEFLKLVISETADLLYEEPALRSVDNKNVTDYLKGYDTTPRTAYQALFGVANYSNDWTPEKLEEEISNRSFYFIKRPQDGDFSINPYELYEKSFGLMQCTMVNSSPAWTPVSDFKISEKMPGIRDGFDGSVWGVLQNHKIEIFVKNAFQWQKLEEYISSKNSNLTISKTAPSLSLGNYWFKTDDIKVYLYGNYDWGSGLTTYYSSTLSGSWNNGDKILNYKNSCLSLYEYDAGRYTRKQISNYIIRKQALNTNFINGAGNNFIIESCNEALLGGIAAPLFDGGGNGMVKVYQDGVFKGEFAGLDFHGPDITVAGENALIEFSALATGNSIVDSEYYDVTADGQTVFDAPANTLAVVEVSVNGVSENSYTYDNVTKKITFDPVQAGYALEIGDSIILEYLKPTV